MITAVAICRLVPGAEQDFRARTERLVASTHQEEASISYDLVRPEGEEGVLAFFERWADQDGLDQHLASPHFQEAMQAIEPLLAEPMDVKIYRSVD